MSLLSELRDNDFVFPDYKNSNLSAIKSIVEGRNKSLAHKKTIFMVVDGLGYNLIEDLLKGSHASLLDQARLEKISTLFPSTTTAVLNSLESGLTPAEHGVIGWDVYQKEFGVVVTPYRDAPAFSHALRLGREGIPSLLAEPALLQKAADKGRISMLLPDYINNHRTIRNGTNVSYNTAADMMVQLRRLADKGEDWFAYAYYSAIDSLEHRYGFSSESVRHGVLSLFRDLNHILLPHLEKNGYNLVITSDHGQMEAKKKIMIKSDDEIMRHLVMPPWGDARTLFMNALPGNEDGLVKTFESIYGKDALIVESGELIDTGIFGSRKVSEKLRHRFGTHIALVKNDKVMKYQYPTEKPKESKHQGFHSGLSEAEMSIPLLTY